VAEWLTPPQIAKERAIRTSKVLHWIASGELEAVNCAEKRQGRPRWRISAQSLAAFDRGRSSRAGLAVPMKPPRKAISTGVTEFC
jgi:hypothetical protein